MGHGDREQPDVSRRDLGALLGVFGGGAALSVLNACASANGSNGPPQFVIPQSGNIINDGTTGVTFARRNVFNVMDFGADPTGAVDSTAAISAAINAGLAGGVPVHLPAGTYLVSSGLTISNPTLFNMRGSGKGLAVIRYTGTGTALTVGPASGSASAIAHCLLTDFRIDISGAPSANGLTMQLMQGFALHRLDVVGAGHATSTGTAYSFLGVNSWQAEDCDARNCNLGVLGDVILRSDGGAEPCSLGAWSGGQITGHNQAVHLTNSQSVKFGRRVNIASNQGAVTVAFDATASCEVSEAYFENNCAGQSAGSGNDVQLGVNGGSATISVNQTLPASTVSVSAIFGFPSAGSFTVANSVAGTCVVSYTSIVGNTFQGCTGGAGVIAKGAAVTGSAATGNDISRCFVSERNPQYFVRVASGLGNSVQRNVNGLTASSGAALVRNDRNASQTLLWGCVPSQSGVYDIDDRSGSYNTLVVGSCVYDPSGNVPNAVSGTLTGVRLEPTVTGPSGPLEIRGGNKSAHLADLQDDKGNVKASLTANLRGTLKFMGGSGATATINLPTPEADSSYTIVLTPQSMTSNVTANSWRVKSAAAASAIAVTVTLEADPGAGQSVTFAFVLIR